MKRIFPAFFFLVVLFTNPCPAICQDDTLSRVRKYLSDMDSIGFSGVILVEVHGKTIRKAAGFSDAENDVRNSDSTVFDIGSLTKQFTASAILKLEMQQKLSTNDTISKYFENVPADKQKITLHDLLRHQSGLISNVGKDFEKISADEFLEKVFQSKLKSQPGTTFSYSNIGYSLLAMIIEKVSGQKYETYLYENLWKPAGMEMTGYSRPAFNKSLIANGYDEDRSTWGKPTDKDWEGDSPFWHLKGNGGVLSTISDMYKWHQCLLSDKVLSDAARAKMYHPRLREEENKNSFYAYGWDVSITERQTKQIWHNGTNHIFYSDFLSYPDEEVTLILLTNRWHPVFSNMNWELSKLIFNPSYKSEIPAVDDEVNRKFTNEILQTIENNGLVKAKEKFVQRNDDQYLLEYLMRDAGFNYIDNGKPETAMQVFEMNAFAFPASAKALQGLGEGFMETGDKQSALKYLKESLVINPYNPFVIRTIKKLEDQ